MIITYIFIYTQRRLFLYKEFFAKNRVKKEYFLQRGSFFCCCIIYCKNRVKKMILIILVKEYFWQHARFFLLSKNVAKNWVKNMILSILFSYYFVIIVKLKGWFRNLIFVHLIFQLRQPFFVVNFWLFFGTVLKIGHQEKRKRSKFAYFLWQLTEK